MITPAFTLSQDSTYLYINIKTPFIKAQDVEIDVDMNQFKFYCNPYFLRLSLPGNILLDGSEKSSYDIDTSLIHLSLPKETKDEFFKDLDLLTTLLESKSDLPKPIIPLIQEISSESSPIEISEECKDIVDYNWEFPQELPKISISSSSYGFNNLYSGYAHQIHALAFEILEISDLDNSTPFSRRQERLSHEDLKFDPDYYIADLMHVEDYQHVLDFKPQSWSALQRIQNMGKDFIQQDPFMIFNAIQQEQMRQLSNKSYILKDERVIILGLVDLMFAYSYNHRTTTGENTVESSWTIVKCSPTLSCFDEFSSLKQVLVGCMRRSLAYPLYRSWELAQKVLKDVTILFKIGKRALLKCLLEIKSILESDEICFTISRLWIVDYCIWIQSCSDASIKSMASELNHYNIDKSEIGWNIEEIHEQHPV